MEIERFLKSVKKDYDLKRCTLVPISNLWSITVYYKNIWTVGLIALFKILFL